MSDAKIDMMAELLKVETKLKKFDCLLPFKTHARDIFEQFNSRQHHYIVSETLQRELDFEFLSTSKIIIDHFPLHYSERKRIQPSWMEYRCRLSCGMIAQGYKRNM